jgi:ABC-type Zn uptake system ZnuABC Zn-binding protein ZnuA
MGAKPASGKKPASTVEKSTNNSRRYAENINEYTKKLMNAQKATLNLLEDLQDAKAFLEHRKFSQHSRQEYRRHCHRG